MMPVSFIALEIVELRARFGKKLEHDRMELWSYARTQ